MKKKIIFMVINMNVGGTEKALLNMISEMPKDEYDVTILMLEKYGGFLNSIPSWVHIEYLNEYSSIKDVLNAPPQEMAWDLLKQAKPIKAANLIFLHIITRIMKDRSLLFKYLLRGFPVLNQEYDLAVAYAGPMDFISYFVAKKIKAKRKIQWIHFDITKIGFNRNFASKIYKTFDKIFVVSNEGKDKLIKSMPTLGGKTEVFHNIVSSEIVHVQSKNGIGFIDKFDGLRILTVGRLAPEKGQDIAIRVLSRLIDDGYKVKWYCLGEGREREYYQKLIKEYNLRDYFVLLGADPNPYPYLNQCDIYIQPSRYEGYCMTLLEARCFNKPIITTDVNGSKEQIKSGETGLIVGISEDDIYNAIKNLLTHYELCQFFSDNLAKYNLSTKHEIKSLSSLF